MSAYECSTSEPQWVVPSTEPTAAVPSKGIHLHEWRYLRSYKAVVGVAYGEQVHGPETDVFYCVRCLNKREVPQ